MSLNPMTRRVSAALFLVVVVGSAFLLARSKSQPRVQAGGEAAAVSDDLHPALHYAKLAGRKVQCLLCPNRCRLSDGQIGTCRARKNVGGRLYSLVYGKVAACHVDPIEKKPFFHVLPGSKSFSIGTPGCNMRCLFCQNWQIAQAFPWEVRTQQVSPEQVVEAAIRTGSSSIAFTYSEPSIFYEYMLDVARVAKAKGVRTVVVSNGFISREPLLELLKYIDAYKIDFKSFRNEFYRDMTGGSLEPILDTMRTIKRSGVWLEVVNLLIPGQNDSEQELREMARWMRANLGDDTPLHFSRFHPMHKLQNLPPTPVDTVLRAREIAMSEGLKFVYTGNTPDSPGDSTYFPGSGKVAIQRRGFFVLANNLKNGVGPDGETIPGIWE